MYKLNPNSKTIKFYNWLWNTDATKYRTMCPLFWKYLLTMVILPAILLAKLIIYLTPAKKQLNVVANYVSETKIAKSSTNIFNKIAKAENFWYIVGKIFKWIGIIFVSLYFIFAIGFIIYQWYLHPMEGFAVFGIIILILTVLFLIMYLLLEKGLGYYIKKPFIFIWDMIYSLYKNMCPIIIWEKDETINKRTVN